MGKLKRYWAEFYADKKKRRAFLILSALFIFILGVIAGYASHA